MDKVYIYVFPNNLCVCMYMYVCVHINIYINNFGCPISCIRLEMHSMEVGNSPLSCL